MLSNASYENKAPKYLILFQIEKEINKSVFQVRGLSLPPLTPSPPHHFPRKNVQDTPNLDPLTRLPICLFHVSFPMQLQTHQTAGGMAAGGLQRRLGGHKGDRFQSGQR